MDDNGKRKRKYLPATGSGRFLPVAAVLAMALAVAMALFFHHKYQAQRDESQKQAILAAGFKEQFDRALDQALELQHQLHAAKEEEKSLQAQRDGAMAEVRKSSEWLKKDLAALESAAAEQESLKAKIKVLEQQVNEAKAVAQVIGKERDALRQSLEPARKEAAAARAELAAASVQLGELKRRLEQVQAEAAKERDAVRKAFSSSLDSLAGGYVNHLSGGMAGLAGAQAAARRAAVLKRLAEMRLAVRSEAASDLLNRLEVVLTRLDLLDPAQTGQGKVFAGLVGNELIPQIDQEILDGAPKPDLLRLLLEARLILTGGTHVP